MNTIPTTDFGSLYAVAYHGVHQAGRTRQVCIETGAAVRDLLSLETEPTEQLRTHTRGGTPLLTVTRLPEFERAFTDTAPALSAIRALPARTWWCHTVGIHPDIQDPYSADQVIDIVSFLIDVEKQRAAISDHVIVCTDINTLWIWVSDEPPAEWLDTRRA